MKDANLHALLVRVANRDKLAFRNMYDLCAPLLFGVLLRMLKDRPEAEDALQEVFIRIWMKASSFDPLRGKAKSWLISIARNHALDLLRRDSGRQQINLEIDEIPSPALRAEDRLVARQQADRVLFCLDQLEQRHAEAVKLAYLLGHSYRELADHFGVPLNTVRTWLRRSLLRLHDCLHETP